MEKKIIITIGRQFGSGGLAVAKELGHRLGIPVYDSELITKAAQDSGFSVEFFEKKDEKRGWASFFSMSFNSNEGSSKSRARPSEALQSRDPPSL